MMRAASPDPVETGPLAFLPPQCASFLPEESWLMQLRVPGPRRLVGRVARDGGGTSRACSSG